MKKTMIVLVLSLIVGLSYNAQSQVLISDDFTGSGNPGGDRYSSFTGSLANDIGPGNTANMTGGGSSITYNTTGNLNWATEFNGGSISIDLSSLMLDGATDPTGMNVIFNNGLTPLLTVGFSSALGTNVDILLGNTGSFAAQNVSLTAPQIAALTNVTSVQIAFNPPNIAETAWQVGFDQLTITGTAIPEPSSFALMGLGGAALYFLRRRRK
jgi:hypothetical protein